MGNLGDWYRSPRSALSLGKPLSAHNQALLPKASMVFVCSPMRKVLFYAGQQVKKWLTRTIDLFGWSACLSRKLSFSSIIGPEENSFRGRSPGCSKQVTTKARIGRGESWGLTFIFRAIDTLDHLQSLFLHIGVTESFKITLLKVAYATGHLPNISKLLSRWGGWLTRHFPNKSKVTVLPFTFLQKLKKKYWPWFKGF